MKCFHVTTEHGARYGVAAHGKREAKQMVQDRLAREDSEAREVGVEPEADHPASAEYVTTWDAEYGTVLCYTGPRED